MTDVKEVKMKRCDQVDPEEVKFRHKRAYMVNVWNGEEVISNRGGISIAYRELDVETIIYAFSVCSFKDNFNRKTGRTMAGGRLKSPKHTITFKGSFAEFHKAITDLEDPKQLKCLVIENRN